MKQNKHIWTMVAAIGILFFFSVIVLFNRETAVAETSGGMQPRAYLPIALKPVGDVLFGPIHSGEGTYYWEADGTGNCLFDQTGNLMIAAMNQYDYGTADLCGAYIQATGPKGSVVVRIVDQCANCEDEQVDFSPEAFAVIADIPDGRVDITWQLISPAITSPIQYHFKDGSSQWWTAVQVRNIRNPVTKFEYWDGTKWVNVQRKAWNYFVEESGMGIGTGTEENPIYAFRVTDYFGNVIVDSSIPHVENGTVTGSSQFPPPP